MSLYNTVSPANCLSLLNFSNKALSYLPDRKFKYNNIIRLNNKQLNLKIGNRIKQSNNFWGMSMQGVKRDGFFAGTLIGESQEIRFPLYKTVEEYNFYRN